MTVMKRFSETNACGRSALINQRRQMRGLGSCSLSAVHAHHVVQSDGLGFVPIGTGRRQQRAFADVRPQPFPASEKGTR
jgi:hypothetical protein